MEVCVLETMKSAILHRSLRTSMPIAVRGEGHHIVDADGRRYLDACGGAAVSCLGHSHQRIVEAICEQARKLCYAHSGFFTTEPAEQLATHLLDRAPEGFAGGRVIFLGSGSEAMEAALKLARQYHVERGDKSRTRFVARNMAYHGNTLGSLAVGGHAQRRAPYDPILIEVGRVPACYAYRLKEPGESDDALGERTAKALETEILRLGPETVAAFIAETVVGATLGCVPAVPGYFARIREICDRYGVLFIADEVMCGMGRTGTLFAIEQEAVAPDIMTIAKGLGAGYVPIAATLVQAKVTRPIEERSGSLWNGHTYMGHAISCAASLAVLKTFEMDNLLLSVREQGRNFRAALEAKFGTHPHIGDIRGRGLFVGIEFVEDRGTKSPFHVSKNLAGRLKSEAMALGLMTYPAQGCADGVHGDHVLLAPPFDVTPGEIETIVDILSKALDRAIASISADTP